MDKWASHLPLLVASVAASTGPILECGVGVWSTPVLHALAAPIERRLVSVESKDDWLDRFTYMRCSWHEIVHTATWDQIPEIDEPWGVVFVDHGHAPRGPVVSALRLKARLIVMHDSECAYCGYSDALHAFDWCWTNIHSDTWTTIAGMGALPPWLESLKSPGVYGVPVPYR